jgi:hypothetical protein
VSYTPVPDTPLLDTLFGMAGESVDRCELPDRELMIARVAALAAVGAPPASYAFNAPAAAISGLTLEDAQGILIAVAPIIGSAKTVEAAGSIAAGLGLALAILEASEEE